MPQNFLDLCDLSSHTLREILDSASRMKRERKRGEVEGQRSLLSGKTLAMIFECPSTRTQVSFSVAMNHLGGHSLILPREQLQLERGETIADTARVLSRFVDCLMLRTSDHGNLRELAEFSDVPVVNGLTNFSHPCQVMADILTFEECVGSITGRRVAWVGDGNNMVHSWLHAAARLGFSVHIASPPAYRPDGDVISWAQENGAQVALFDSAEEAVAGADCVMTDTWVSMSDTDTDLRHQALKAYAVDSTLMDKAASGAIFMHCLPAHRGEEVSADVIDGARSVVFDEAENRLHIQKAILVWCMLGETEK